MPGFDGPRAHDAADADTQRRHPTHAEEPPEGFGRIQLLGLAVLFLSPVMIYLVFKLF
jgi:hypothetical protein